MRQSTTQTWPLNAGNSISEEHNFKHFTREDALSRPHPPPPKKSQSKLPNGLRLQNNLYINLKRVSMREK